MRKERLLSGCGKGGIFLGGRQGSEMWIKMEQLHRWRQQLVEYKIAEAYLYSLMRREAAMAAGPGVFKVREG